MCGKHAVSFANNVKVCHDLAKTRGILRAEAEAYFHKKYSKANFRVVPGCWPVFANINEVDKWFKLIEGISITWEDLQESQKHLD